LKIIQHNYVERDTGQICSERPIGDWIVNYLYSKKREEVPFVYQLLGSQWFSGFLGWVNYDFPLGQNITGIRRFLKNCAIDLSECLDKPEELDSARKIFERRIRYWQWRPMTEDASAVVSPSDSRLLIGSFKDTSTLFLKGKFFEYEELLGPNKTSWLRAFHDGDFVICRLTPEKYHYNHTPVAGVVRDFYENDGNYHSCNPGPVVSLATPYSKNKRVVTVIIPIQAMTSLVYILAGLGATFLFLKSNFAVAFIVTISLTQGWRTISETLRADYRGSGRLSVYQIMSISAICLALALICLLPAEHAITPDLPAGMEAAWRPAVVLFLQGLWAIVFLLFGKSMVTGSRDFFSPPS
jgi:phosphatidylserine decarboxylase precursor